MMPQMNMPQMPMSAMPQAMMGQMPMMSPMMGMMSPMMMHGMPNMMMGMMPMMPSAPPVMCRMTMEMGKDGITCKMTPMDPAGMDMLRERCESMMRAMALGVPFTMISGGQTLFCTPAR